MNPVVVHGEPAFHLETPEVTLDVTVRGGQLAPVIFHLPGRDVSPYSLAPWQPAEFPEIPPLLSVLRGDFFCIPFAGREGGPPHGDPANAEWSLTGHDDRSLTMEMQCKDTPAFLRKVLSVRTGEHAIYADHQVSGLDGDYSYGNHPILDLSGLPENGGRVTTSAFRWGSVFPGVFSNPEAGERQALAEGTRFTDLRKVQLTGGGTTDLTFYPQRAGFEDLIMLTNEPATDRQPFAWSAVVMDGYVWFALKNPADFPATLFWMSNGGRSAAPWQDRHIGRLGIEEVCSYFCNGLEQSRQNLLSAEDIPTTRHFAPGETVSLRTVQAVAPVPKDFGEVLEILPDGDGAVIIRGGSGATASARVDWNFVLRR